MYRNSLLLLVLAGVGSSARATDYTLTDVGGLDASTVYTTARDINSSGVVVGWSYKSSDGDSHAFMYDSTTATMTELSEHHPAGSGAGSGLYAINENGTMAGQCAAGTDEDPVIWTSATSYSSLDQFGDTFFGGATYVYGTVFDVNDSDLFVGRLRNTDVATKTRPVFWDQAAGSAQFVAEVASITDRAGATYAVNNSGVMVGKVATNAFGYDYPNDTYVRLANGSYSSATAYGINDSEVVVGCAQGTYMVPVYWDTISGSPVELSLPSGYNSGCALDINTDGTIVGRAFNSGSAATAQPVIWEGDTPVDVFSGLGYYHGIAYGINDDGWVTGRYQSASGTYYHGFMLSIETCLDTDGDGYCHDESECPDGSTTSTPGCELDDCDETNVNVNPGEAEIPYDGLDNDCGGIDVTDADGDGYDAEVVGGEDCDDLDASINPGASDAFYDDIDSNCDGADEWDADGDGYQLEAYNPDRTAGGGDCDDSDASINPGAYDDPTNSIDEDCSGAANYDADGDGYSMLSAGGTDCDDSNSSIYPGAPDTWYDGIDSDCAGDDDYDQDGDGYQHESSPTSVVDDCDDTDASVVPFGTETMDDGVDSDCDGFELCYEDADDDGYHDGVVIESTDLTCTGSGVAKLTDPDGDCDDSDAAKPDPDGCPPTGYSIIIEGGADYTGASPITIEFTVDDPSNTEMCFSEVYADCTDPSDWYAFTDTEYRTPAAAGGLYTYFVTFRNADDQQETERISDSIYVDYAAPGDGDLTVGQGDGELPVSWTEASDSGSGVDHYILAFNRYGGEAPAYFCNLSGASDELYDDNLDSTVTDVTVPDLEVGIPIYFRLCAVDAMGNTSSGIAAWGYAAPEYNAPEGSITIVEDYSQSEYVDVTPTCTDDSSCEPNMDLYNSGEYPGLFEDAFTSGTPIVHDLNTAGVSSTVTVYGQFKDEYSTPSALYSDTVVYDSTVPVNSGLTAGGGDGFVTLSWADGTDDYSGVVGYYVMSSEAAEPGSCSAASADAYVEGNEHSYLGLDNGTTYYFRVCAVDAAGNVASGATVAQKAYLELNPPEVDSFTLKNGTNTAWTNKTTVTASLVASDDTEVSTMCVSNTTSCTTFIDYSTSFSHKLGGSGSTRTAYAKVNDSSANTSPQVSDSIGYDATRPVNGTMTATTDSSGIAVSWSGYSDATSGVDHYVVTRSAASATGAPTSCLRGTIVYSGSDSSTVITGLDSFKKYYIRVCAVDAAGNYSTGKTASATSGSGGGGGFGS